MPTSSATFVTVLRPDPRLRRLLLACALLGPPVGLALIAALPLPWWLRAALGGIWIAVGVCEYRAQRRGALRIRRYVLDALDNISAVAAGGRRLRVELLAGSLVLPRLAYLRLRLPDGRHYAELLRPCSADDLDWQRLLLIWRLRRKVVGAHEVS